MEVWFETLRLPVVRETAGSRVFDIATQSALRYFAPPSFDGGVVRAVFVDRDADGEHEAFEVVLRHTVESPLTGQCSHCRMTFGPCVHVVTLLVDLASCRALREALRVQANETALREAALEAMSQRAINAAEKKFQGTLTQWVGTGEPLKLQLAATPSNESLSYGRGYGESYDPDAASVLTVAVRTPGERKLLSPGDVARADLAPRDKSVLLHAAARGVGRKSFEARGVRASLALEAMRKHGAVYGPGFKGLLLFKHTPARPTLSLVREPSPTLKREIESLRAFWEIDGATTPMRDVFFFPGPFPYVWLKSGTIHRVAPDVDLELAMSLAKNPELIVPPGRREDAGARVLRAMRGRGVALPAPETFGLTAIETPRIVLRLAGEPLAFHGELVAVYKSREISLFQPGAETFEPDGRDLDLEERARRHIRDAGLIVPPDEDDDDVEGMPKIGAFGEEAIHVWQTGLPLLRAAADPPVEVQLNEKLAKVKLGAAVTARVTVVLEGDWLDTTLEFTSRQLKVELAQIRRALERKEKWLALDDGTLARIGDSAERLVHEAETIMGESSNAKLAAFHVARLDRWLQENDGRADAAVHALREKLRALEVADTPKMPKRLQATLRPYQARGLAWLQFLDRLGAGGILADDMGLGKTVTALAYLLRRKQDEGQAPSLVVCPTSVAPNWVSEAKRFTPTLKVLLLHGPAPGERAQAAIAKHDVVVTTYAQLRRDEALLESIDFRCVVLDEAQYIKNDESATRHAAGKLRAQTRLALTGTPIENRLKELWSIASFVNPGMLGTARTFEKRYERPIAMDRQSALATELRSIVRPFLLRRTKDEVLTDLPPKTEVDRFVELAPADKRLYEALALTLRESVAKSFEQRAPGSGPSLEVFAALTRLRQMACEPRLVDPTLPAERSAKREVFLDLVHELVAEGRRALVFSQFVQLLTLWRADLDAEEIPYEYLDGSTVKREEVVQRFQRGKAPLFLISLKAGGAGLNLTAADTVIHCDPWWNPAVEDQATDRAYRIGQDKPVTVVRLVATGTIEEKILSLKQKKRELTSAIISGNADALRGLTEGDILDLLGGADAKPPSPKAARVAKRALGEGEPTELFATESEVLKPEYQRVVEEAQRWLATTGGFEAELASKTGIPVMFAARLLKGEPFPCSRATATRIVARLREF